MRVNSVNLTVPKSRNTFGASANGRSPIADLFPLGVQVEEVIHEGSKALCITFPEKAPLSADAANKLINEQVLPFSRYKDGFEQIYGSRVYYKAKIDRLILKTKEAILITSLRLREFVQARAQAKFALIAIETADATKKAL